MTPLDEIAAERRRQTDQRHKSPKEIASKLAESMPCNCDLDRWEPERSTGHSCVCRIHKAAWTAWAAEREGRR